MIRLTFFTRVDCQLCHAALFVVRKVVAGRAEVRLEVVDIDDAGQEHWADLYGEHIPVVQVDGREICRHRVDESALRRQLPGPRGA